MEKLLKLPTIGVQTVANTIFKKNFYPKYACDIKERKMLTKKQKGSHYLLTSVSLH